jgi:endonuclease/exonuclease/phosphatase family metal-dependent hydrolase
MAQRAAGDLRVMTFNIRVDTILDVIGNSWHSRKAHAVRAIRDFDPDILGTQEALASQSDYLRAQLPDYGFVGAGRDDGQRSGEMCGIFYRLSRFTKIESGHFWLSDRPNVPGSRSWGSAFTRMVTWIKLRPRDGSRAICVFNTHFDVFGARARRESARLLRAKMQAIAPNMPCIVTGDFNDLPNSAPYQLLLAGTSSGHEKLIDSYRAAYPKPAGDEGTRHGFSGSRTGPRIDWIVATDDFQPVAAKIVRPQENEKLPSDHFPVVSILRPVGSPPAPVARVE